MSAYVQQNIKQIPITFTGPWFDVSPPFFQLFPPKNIDFVKHSGMCFMTVPELLVHSESSDNITGRIPDNFAPFQHQNCFGWGVASETDFPIAFEIFPDGTFIISIMPGHQPFSAEGGNSGFYAQTFCWQLNTLNQD